MLPTKDSDYSWLDGRLRIQPSVDNPEIKEVVGYYPNSTILQFKHSLKNDQFDGWCRSYYENGNLHSEGFYINGKINGYFREYFPDGSCSYSGEFKDGNRCGTHYSWGGLGKLLSEKFYSEGQIEGIARDWFPSSQLKVKAEYEHGKLHGKYLEWFKSGQCFIIADYKNNKFQGVHCEWFPNGKLGAVKYYQKGLLNGPFKQWYDNGVLKYHGTYVSGQLHGPAKEWHNNGKQKLSANYVRGRFIGEAFHWDRKGKLSSTDHYIRGVRVPDDIYKLIITKQLTARHIISITNITIRRLCLEEFGYARFLLQLDHTVLNIDGDSELVKLNWHPREEPLYLVKVKCPTTGAFYALRVPPTMKTVKEAVAWTFGLKSSEYKPEAEA